MGGGGGGEWETEFTSTEPPRHSAPDCDIYPPSFQPTLCFYHPRVSSLPSRLPSYTPGGSTPHIDPLPSASFTTAIPLRGPLRRALSIYEVSTPLLTALRHHCAFATIPQCSLGLRVGVGVRERENQAGGRLSALLLPRRSLYIVPLEEKCFFTSFFFFFFSRVGGSAFVGCAYSKSPDDSRCLDRRPCLRPFTLIRTVIDISNVSKLLFHASANLFNHSFLIFLRIKNPALRFI